MYHLGTTPSLYDPFRAARVIFENSKIFSIFGAAPLAPTGASQLWPKIKLAPSCLHVVYKFQHASFKGCRNIKGGTKHTKMEKNRVIEGLNFTKS